MSTKTTFKRIALVAVAAMGFGVLTSVAPATAGPGSMSVPITSFTVVGGHSSSNYAYIPVNLTEAGIPQALQTGESLTATVIGWPTGVDSTTAASDILFSLTKRTAQNTWAKPTMGGSATSAENAAGSFSIQASATDAVGLTSPTSGLSGTYHFGLVPASSSKAYDKGTYTVRIRFVDSTGFITSTNVSINWVTSAADSGARITLASSGTFVAGETVTMSATQSLTATLDNGTTGGRVTIAGATNAGPGIPDLTVGLWAGTTPALVGATTDWYASDTGTQAAAAVGAYDFVSTTASDSGTAYAARNNGVYGIGHVANSSTSGLGVTSLSVAPFIRVTYGATAATRSLTVTNAASGVATGIVFTGVGARTASTPFTLPLTTKTASISVAGATPGSSYRYTVAYTLVGAGDQTPLGATPTTVVADASGRITVPVTVANPVDGSIAAVTISGFATNPAVQTINWVRSKATNISVDMGGATVALKSTNVFTATVTDAFGAPVAGFVLQPSLLSTGSNGSATLVLPTVTTNASGQATYSLTDALAVAGGTDRVTFAATDGTTLAGTASATITYAATAPAPTALTAAFSGTPATSTTDAAIITPVPATGAYRSGTQAFTIQKARNNGVVTTIADSADQIRVRIGAGVAGARIVATASTGAYILNAAGLQVSTLTSYTGTTGFAPSFVLGSNKTGANTVTFTSGTASTTVAFWVENTGTDARFVKLAQASAGSPVVATVTDRYGNGVSGASVQISTSAGTLGNGQMTTVYVTDLDGKVSVLPVGSESAVITATATATNADHAALAGFSGSTPIDSTVAAGNSTATLTVIPTASAQDVAQAATDAAAEATDAANAATDAANAAAEAADAATAAAQDAADAVAALSTQVTELVTALRKQITSLTNLVIKIQKKVRA